MYHAPVLTCGCNHALASLQAKSPPATAERGRVSLVADGWKIDKKDLFEPTILFELTMLTQKYLSYQGLPTVSRRRDSIPPCSRRRRKLPSLHRGLPKSRPTSLVFQSFKPPQKAPVSANAPALPPLHAPCCCCPGYNLAALPGLHWALLPNLRWADCLQQPDHHVYSCLQVTAADE